MSKGKGAERPVNLALTKFAFPLAAIASITHRITGVLLFVGVGFLLYVLSLGLTSTEGFLEAAALLEAPPARLVLLGVLAVLAYHLFAGLKHMLLDFHVGDTIEAARLGSQVVFILTIAAVAALGVWLW